MFITSYTITREGDRIGVLRFNKEGFSIPNFPELLEPISNIIFNGHNVRIIESNDKVAVQIIPNDLTKNMILRGILRRLKYTSFVLEPYRFDSY